MPENIENFLNSRYGQQIFNQEFGRCLDCNQSKTSSDWCKNCNTKRFRKDFDKWTSGNEFVDKFIQNAQSRARNRQEVIEWISYEQLIDIKYLAQGGFSTIFKAIWLVGEIEKWDNKNQQWERYAFPLENDYKRNIKSSLNEKEKAGRRVVLKSLNNSSNIEKDFLNEVNDNIMIIFII